MKLSDFLSEHQISQADFANRIGATQAAVSRYLDGKRMPRRYHLARIKEATGGSVTADDFVGAAFTRKSPQSRVGRNQCTPARRRRP